MPELTPAQLHFLEALLEVPRLAGDSPDADRRQAWAAEFRRFNAGSEAVRARVAALADAGLRAPLLVELDAAGTQLVATPGRPDIDRALARIDAVDRRCRALALEQDCRRGLERVSGAVKALLADWPAVADEIVMIHDFALESARRGVEQGTADDLRAALAAVAKLELALAAAAATAHSEALAAAAAALQRQRERFDALQLRLNAAFGDTWPPALVLMRAPLRVQLTAGDVETAESLAEKTRAGALLIDQLDAAAVAPLAGLTQCQDALAALINGPLSVLRGHPMAADPLVAPELAAVDLLRQQAEVKMGLFEYGGAADDLGAAAKSAALAVARADVVARFHDTKVDREQRVASMAHIDVTAIPSEHAQVKDAVVKARQLWGDVKAAFDTADLVAIQATAPNLAALPAAVDDALRLYKDGGQYATEFAGYAGAPALMETAVGTFDEALKRPLQLRIQGFKAQIDAANVATTRDFRRSIALMSNINNACNEVWAKIGEVRDHVQAKVAFEQRQTELRLRQTEPGFVAVLAYSKRLDDDQLHAQARVEQGEFAMATRVLSASQPMHGDQIALLNRASDYFNQRKSVVTDLKALDDLPRADAAVEGKLAVNTLLGDAEAAQLASDWIRAQVVIGIARQRLTAAEATAKAAESIDQAVDQAVIDGIGDDVEAAMKVYQKVVDAVHSAGADVGPLAGQALRAQDLRNRAWLAATGDPAQPAQALALLNDAVAVCRRMVRLKGQQDAFDVQLGELRGLQADIVNRSLNIDNYYDTEVGDLGRLILEAETAAKPDGFEFVAAEQKLAAARPLYARVYNTWQAYVSARDARLQMGAVLTWMDDPARRDGVPDEIAALRELVDELDRALVARDPSLAATKGQRFGALRWGFEFNANSSAQYRKMVTDTLEPALLALPDTMLYSRQERETLTRLRNEMAANAKAKAYFAAQALLNQAVHLAGRCKQLETQGAEQVLMATAAQQALQAMRLRVPLGTPALDGPLLALEQRFAAAGSAATLRNFGGALERLQGLVEAVAELEPKVVVFEACSLARVAAEQALAGLGQLPDASAIEPMLVRLSGQLANGATLAAAGDHAAARSLFDDMLLQVDRARAAVQDVAAYQALGEELLAGLGSGETAAALERAQGFIDTLKQGPGALFVFDELLLAMAAMTRAREAADPEPHLAEVMRLCSQARLSRGLFEQLRASEAQARKAVDDLMASHQQAGFVRDGMLALTGRLDRGMAAVRQDSALRPDTQALIEAVMVDFYRLRAEADAQIQVAQLVADISPALATMEKHSHRFAIADDIAEVKLGLAEGQAWAREHRHPEALVRLRAARAKQVEALLAAQMHAGQTPDQATLKDILARPDGPQTLDGLVAKLDPKAQRRVMVDVFQARFGCKLELHKDSGFEAAEWSKFNLSNPSPTPEQIENKRKEIKALNLDDRPDEKAADILRFYTMMAKLPPTDTLDNDSLQLFVSKGGAPGSPTYNPASKEVCMIEIPESYSGYYPMGLPHEVGDVDDNCKPKEGERLTFFSWNTLHEVGHAVDDKLGFMSSRGKALAGWDVYGADPLPVAAKIAERYHYDRDYVAAYMSGNTYPAQPEPTDKSVDADEWERRRVNAVSHVDRIRSGRMPWQSMASAQATDIGGICYQESYPGTWTSYPFDKRKQAVSGYQFRAPAEWFAELFAALHSGKLNDDHPARVWLEKL